MTAERTDLATALGKTALLSGLTPTELKTLAARTVRKLFTAGELLTNKVREAVAGRAEQTPEYKIIRNSGHDSGDFIFIKK